jgi:hypothetical protein
MTDYKFYIGLFALLFFAAFVNILFPWYVTFTIAAIAMLLIVVFLKVELGLFLIIIAIVLAGTQPHLMFQLRWSTVVDRYPVILLPLLAVLFVRLLLDRISGLRNGIDRSPLRVALFFLFSWAVFSLFWAPYFWHSLTQLTIFAYNLLLFYIITYAVNDERMHKRLMWCLLLSGVAALSIAYSIKYLELMVYHVHVSNGIKVEFLVPGGQRRLIALGWSCQELSMTMNFAMSVAIGLLVSEEKIVVKFVLGVIIIAMFSALLSTMTKGGLIAFVAMIHFLMVSIEKLRKSMWRNLFIVYMGAVGIFYAQIVLSGITREPRLLVYSGKGAFSLTTRIKLWKVGLQGLLDTSGIGMAVGTFNYKVRQAPHAHNIFFDYIFDFGFMGLLFLVLAGLYFLKLVFEAFRNQSTYLQTMRLAMIGGLIAIGTHGLVDFGYNNTPIWLFLGLAVATFSLVKKENQRVAGAQSGPSAVVGNLMTTA